MKRRRKVRKWRRQFATWLTAVSDAVASMSASAGVFRHRGVLVLHPGLLIDQIGVAAAIDQAIDEAIASQGVEFVRRTFERSVYEFDYRFHDVAHYTGSCRRCQGSFFGLHFGH